MAGESEIEEIEGPLSGTEADDDIQGASSSCAGQEAAPAAATAATSSPSTCLPSEAGIVPRALADLFHRVGALKAAGHDVQVQCSMLEIHNERVHDLLEEQRMAGEQRVPAVTAPVGAAGNKLSSKGAEGGQEEDADQGQTPSRSRGTGRDSRRGSVQRQSVSRGRQRAPAGSSSSNTPRRRSIRRASSSSAGRRDSSGSRRASSSSSRRDSAVPPPSPRASIGGGAGGDCLRIRNDPELGLWAEGAAVVPLTSAEEAMGVFRQGQAARAVAETLLNRASSRSHALFCLWAKHTAPATSGAGADDAPSQGGESTLTDPDPMSIAAGSTTTGRLLLVDLAGSELASKTGAEGATLREASSINRSLSALGNVIMALTQGKDHIPYRDSKLTRLLQDSLGGNSRTRLVVTVSPAAVHAAETQSTLRFGTRASLVKCKPKASVQLGAEEARRRIERLQRRLSIARDDFKALATGESLAPERWQMWLGKEIAGGVDAAEVAKAARTAAAQSMQPAPGQGLLSPAGPGRVRRSRVSIMKPKQGAMAASTEDSAAVPGPASRPPPTPRQSLVGRFQEEEAGGQEGQASEGSDEGETKLQEAGAESVGANTGAQTCSNEKAGATAGDSATTVLREKLAAQEEALESARTDAEMQRARADEAEDQLRNLRQDSESQFKEATSAYRKLEAEHDKLHQELAAMVSDMQEEAARAAAIRHEAAEEAQASIEQAHKRAEAAEEARKAALSAQVEAQEALSQAEEKVEDLQQRLRAESSERESAEEEAGRLTKELQERSRKIAALEETHQDLESQVESLSRARTEGMVQLKTAVAAHSAVMEQLAETEDRADKAEAAAKTATEELQDARRAMTSALRQAGDTRDRMDSLRAVSESGTKGLERALRKAQQQAAKAAQASAEQNEQLQAQLDGSRKEATELQAQLDGSRKEATELQAQLDGSRKEATELQAQLDGSRKEATELQAQLDGSRKEATELQAQLDGSRKEATELQAQLDGSRKEATELQAQLDGSRKEATELQAQLDGSRKEATELQAQLDGSRKEATELQAQLDGSRKEATELQAQLDGSRKEATELQAQLDGSRKEATELQAHLDGSRKEATELQAHLDGSRKEATELQAQLDGSRKEATELQAQLNGSRKEAMELQEQVKQATHSIESVQQQVEELKHAKQHMEVKVDSLEKMLEETGSASQRKLHQTEETLRESMAESQLLKSAVQQLEGDLRQNQLCREQERSKHASKTEALRSDLDSAERRLSTAVNAAHTMRSKLSKALARSKASVGQLLSLAREQTGIIASLPAKQKTQMARLHRAHRIVVQSMQAAITAAKDATYRASDGAAIAARAAVTIQQDATRHASASTAQFSAIQQLRDQQLSDLQSASLSEAMQEARAAVVQARLKDASAASGGFQSPVAAAALPWSDDAGLLAIEKVTQGRSDKEARAALEKALVASWGQESIARLGTLVAERAHSKYREDSARANASWERAVSQLKAALASRTRAQSAAIASARQASAAACKASDLVTGLSTSLHESIHRGTRLAAMVDALVESRAEARLEAQRLRESLGESQEEGIEAAGYADELEEQVESLRELLQDAEERVEAAEQSEKRAMEAEELARTEARSSSHDADRVKVAKQAAEMDAAEARILERSARKEVSLLREMVQALGGGRDIAAEGAGAVGGGDGNAATGAATVVHVSPTGSAAQSQAEAAAEPVADVGGETQAAPAAASGVPDLLSPNSRRASHRMRPREAQLEEDLRAMTRQYLHAKEQGQREAAQARALLVASDRELARLVAREQAKAQALEAVVLQANGERTQLATAKERAEQVAEVLRRKQAASAQAAAAEESHLKEEARLARVAAADASSRADRFRRDARTILRRAAELAMQSRRASNSASFVGTPRTGNMRRSAKAGMGPPGTAPSKGSRQKRIARESRAARALLSPNVLRRVGEAGKPKSRKPLQPVSGNHTPAVSGKQLLPSSSPPGTAMFLTPPPARLTSRLGRSRGSAKGPKARGCGDMQDKLSSIGSALRGTGLSPFVGIMHEV